MLCNSLLKTVEDKTHKHVSQIHEIQCVLQRKELYFKSSFHHMTCVLGRKPFFGPGTGSECVSSLVASI